ncbi:Alcohol dehydrogenase superfamily, zinc-type [Corchorus olitorius]|uniref:Alcohol dehydrogenase superfamily, zinc-type n=1 Tax=Corchorus olitorius TaxID=93759 RepID=A0A1R3ISF5_9ROSI|nr:Alcohol dehydrogenase superfamily, zinc-type [Corchorus olitorius]
MRLNPRIAPAFSCGLSRARSASSDRGDHGGPAKSVRSEDSDNLHFSLSQRHHLLELEGLASISGSFQLYIFALYFANINYLPELVFVLKRVVESVGENVNEVAEGDVVIPTFLSDCGECADCCSEKSNLCSKFPFKVHPWMPRYEASRFTDLNGDVLYHFLNVSSFTEYTVLDISHVVKIDPAIPPNRACLFGCCIATGVGAACKTAKVEAGSTVVIFGIGSIGLAVAKGAKLCGAKRIIGVDINPDKFEIGKKFGVTEFINSKECGDKSLSQVIIEMTGGGADYCFECVGLASLVQEAYASCRKGWGKTIVMGVDKPGAQLNFNSFEVLHSGKALMGSLYGGAKPKSDVPLMLKQYMDKVIN